MADTKIIARSGDPGIDGLLYALAWNGAVTYSVPRSAADYGIGYGDAAIDGFAALSATQVNALACALDADGPLSIRAAAGFSVEGFTDLTVTASADGAGDIRAANCDGGDGTAYAYLPSQHPMGGDIWFETSGRSPVPGNYDHYAVLHEVGHALGLKHGHETDDFGTLPRDIDATEFTVMSYRSDVQAPGLGLTFRSADSAPQTFMIHDIAALQHIYGADFTTNAGDTHYAWKPDGTTWVDGDLAIDPAGSVILMSLWDGGGRDVYDFSAFGGGIAIDLAPGAASVLGAAQTAYVGSGRDAGGSIYNAFQYQGDARSLIEDAIAGAGSDRLSGNQADNRLEGGAGHDTILGLGGADRLLGGAGDDRIQAGVGHDVIRAGTGSDKVWGGGGQDRVFLGRGDDVFRDSAQNGANGADAVKGGAGQDRLLGRGGADRLYGGSGNDLLQGGTGDDRLLGGGGADRLCGGQGRDVFVFTAPGQSAPGAADRIIGASRQAAFDAPGAALGDLIDLRGIDANAARSGDQAFVLGKSGAGGVRLFDAGRDTVLRGNVDADATWELEIRIRDGASISAKDYTIDDFLL
ncbi:MAG: M10 family metallopeptidase C-terminal domain-containing protein [Sedimentitalea sp.]|nr:M10 family metallopeptidase C-terminal domain-containing protein [Sedimentitalea sp.]